MSNLTMISNLTMFITGTVKKRLQVKVHLVPTFQDDLCKVLGRHFPLSGEALVHPSVTLDHAVHYECLLVRPLLEIDHLPIAVPGHLILVGAGHHAGEGNLASHTALQGVGTHYHLQGLWKCQQKGRGGRDRS